jgi:CheY-like chemotaxis protein
MNDEPYVLYVEDDIDDAFFMKRAFQRAKRPEKLLVVNCGADAMEQLGEGTKTLPKFVLLDIKMARMTGLELLAWIRRNVAAQLPVFMLSSSSQERDLKAAQALGSNGYLLKPSNAIQLEHLVNSLAAHCEPAATALASWIHFDGKKLSIEDRSG